VKSRKFDITPDIRLLVDIGEANYEVPQAISELIANSMDARFDEEKVNVEVLINDEFISITDNGKGMSENVLAEALRLAAQMDSVTGNTKARKGMYGLGLKAACASLGKHWEIFTRPHNDSNQYSVEIDLANWLKKKDRKNWEVEVETTKFKEGVGPLGSLKHGTCIKISNLKENFHMVAAVIEKLGMAYKPHLEFGDTISVNGAEVTPKTFSLVENRKYTIDIEIMGHRVTGWYGLDTKTHNSGDYGINIYREKQLVEAWNKDFIRAHLMSSRVVGEIDLPFIAANFHKLGFNKTTEEWRLVKKYMTEELKPVVKASGQMAQNKKDNLRQAKAIRGLDIALGLISPDDQDFNGVIDNGIEGSGQKPAQRKPSNVASGNYQTLKLGEDEIPISHVFERLDETIPWDFIFDEDSGDLQAVINTDSLVFTETTDVELIAILALAEAVMGYSIKHRGLDYAKAKENRDNWLHLAISSRRKALAKS
jgi:hypothetical protein